MVQRHPELTVRLSRILAPVTVLGPGLRVAMWVQGCMLACPGCASTDTWDPSEGSAIAVAPLAAMVVRHLQDFDCEGLTITGGEPSDQGAGLAAMLRLIREHDEAKGLDVLLFTGRTGPAARVVAPELMSLVDCVVAGPYRQELPAGGRLVASENQTIEFATPRVQARYAAWLSSRGSRLQVMVDDKDLYVVGLPEAGDLNDFESRLRDRGIELADVTWRQ